VDASVAEAAAGAEAAADAEVAGAVADAGAAAVKQILEYSVRKDPCMSQCRGLYLYKKYS
jgi:hypothetical protein